MLLLWRYLSDFFGGFVYDFSPQQVFESLRYDIWAQILLYIVKVSSALFR